MHHELSATRHPPLEISISQFGDYREFLKEYVRLRQLNSKSWSFGVWARALGLKSPSTLIMIVNGQRHPGPKLIAKLKMQLGLNRHDSFYFESLIRMAKLRHDVRASLEVLNDVKKKSTEQFTRILDEQSIATLSAWHNWAIRELTKTKDFSPDPHWISARLAKPLTAIEIRQSIAALIQMGLLEHGTGGKLVSAQGHSKTSSDVTSKAIQKFHAQTLNLIQDQLKSLSPDYREVSGVCFPMKLKDLGAAKAMIRKFQSDFCEKFETSDGSADEVYMLEVCFVPFSNISESKLVSRSDLD